MADVETDLYQQATFQAAVDTPYQGVDWSVIVYGALADVLLIAPILMYILIPDSKLQAQYHQTYINMIAAAFGPIGIIWWIVLADDSRVAREALTGAVEMAGLGPFALLWVGYLSFLMSAQSGGNLGTNWDLWIFSILYFVMNVGLIVAHWYLSPPVYAWIATAPLPEKKRVPVDDTSNQSLEQATAQEFNDAAVTSASTIGTDIGF